MKVVYICAPYRANDPFVIEVNIAIARMMAARMWEQDHIAVCPQSNSSGFEVLDLPDQVFLEGYLQLLERCDAISVAVGWKESEGCRAEVARAKELGLEFIGGLPGEEVIQ